MPLGAGACLPTSTSPLHFTSLATQRPRIMPLPALSLEPVPLAAPPAADGPSVAASPGAGAKAEPLLQPPARLRGIGADGELEYG